MAYGLSFSRYREPKRAMEDLELGPLVETHMNRCISCTRCVRFTPRSRASPRWGRRGAARTRRSRATSTRRWPRTSRATSSTSARWARWSQALRYKGRPWELVKTESVDVMDALGSNIRVDSKGREVMRILPRNHDGVNEEWISDKTRFVWDGPAAAAARHALPAGERRLRKASWGEALGIAAQALRSGKVAGLVGDLAPVEAAFALKDLMARVGGTVECRTDGARLVTSGRGGYAGNARIEDLASPSGSCCRVEPAARGAGAERPHPGRLAQGRRGDGDRRGGGPHLRLRACGRGPRGARAASRGRAAGRGDAIVVVGRARCARRTGEAVLAQVLAWSRRWGQAPDPAHGRGARGRDGRGLPGPRAGMQPRWRAPRSSGTWAPTRSRSRPGPSSIYQGSHGDRGAHRADLILPAPPRPRRTGFRQHRRAAAARAARGLRARRGQGELGHPARGVGRHRAPAALGQPAQLRQALVAAHPLWPRSTRCPRTRCRSCRRPLGSATFRNAVRDFFLTNPIARASKVMGELSALERGGPSGRSRRSDAAGRRPRKR
jgi:NADH-quinone oxidoreductase subunit G